MTILAQGSHEPEYIPRKGYTARRGRFNQQMPGGPLPQDARSRSHDQTLSGVIGMSICRTQRHQPGGTKANGVFFLPPDVPQIA